MAGPASRPWRPRVVEKGGLALIAGGPSGFPLPTEVDVVVRCMIARGYQSFTVTLLPALAAPGCYEVLQEAVPTGEGLEQTARGLYRPNDQVKDREVVYRQIVRGEEV